MHEGDRFERRQPFGRPPPLGMQGLERDHPADHLFAPLGRHDPRLDGGDLRLEMRELRPQCPRRDRRRAGRPHPLEHVVAAGLQRRDRRHRRILRVEPLHRRAEVREHLRHGGPVEACRQLVEPPAAAVRLQGPQLVQFVEAEGHHAGEGGFVDIADEVLEIDAVAG
jgi:hypothetical protein